MSCYLIKYIQGTKMMCPVGSAEEYRRLRDGERQRMTVAEVRQGLAEGRPKEELDMKKRSLLQFNYSCIPGEDGKLKGVRTVSTSIGMDIDFDHDDLEYDRKMAEAKETVVGKAKELGLLMMERSVKKGYHIVFRRRFDDGIDEGKALENQEKNLRWASELLGVAFDKGAKDCTRVFFATTASQDDLIYLDEELFNHQVMRVKTKETQETHETTPETTKEAKAEPLKQAADGAGMKYGEIPYSLIVKKYWEIFNDGKEPCMGDRNVKTFELAMTLRSICDYSQEMMEKIIPRYDGFPEEEWRKTITNALSEPRKGMPYRLKQVLDRVKDDNKLRMLSSGGKVTDAKTMDITSMTTNMPERPKRMPRFLSVLSSKVQPPYKAMVEESIWPAICAHLGDTKFRYIDGTDSEANISSALIGRQSAGKGQVNQPIEYVLADITQKDIQNETRENTWREHNQCRGATKDKQPRPKNIIIQRLDKDLTPAALSQSLIDGERNGNKRIITKVDEIELLSQVGNGKTDTVSLLVRYGFDGGKWGQKRVGLDSVNGSYTVRWVWNASCTTKRAHRFITKDWVANGSLSRLNINTVIREDGCNSIPVVKEYDDQYAADLKVFIDRVNAASGTIECKAADKLAHDMLKEHNDIADLCESEGYRVFSYRAVKIGWLKACILYIMNDYKWDKSIAEYAAYSVRRDLWAKFNYFGEEIEEEFMEEKKRHSTGLKNMLSLLPKEFTYGEYLTVRRELGKEGDGKDTLRSWVHRGHIRLDEVTGRYVRLS